MRMLPNSRQPISNFCNIFIFYTIRQENLSFEWLSPIVSKVSRLYGKNGRVDGKQGRLKTYRGVPYAFRRPLILLPPYSSAFSAALRRETLMPNCLSLR